MSGDQRQLHIPNYVNYTNFSQPCGLIELPSQPNDDNQTILNQISKLRGQIQVEIISLKQSIDPEELQKNINLLIEDIPNIQEITNQHLRFQNVKAYLIENKNYVNSLKNMSETYYDSDSMKRIKRTTIDVLNFFNKLESYRKASRLFDINMITELQIEKEIEKYWNIYFKYTGLTSIEKFIDDNNLILDYEKRNDNDRLILTLNFEKTISKIFRSAVRSLFDQNPSDHQIILFNLLSYVTNLDAIKIEIEYIYSERIKLNSDIFKQENYPIADFFSMLDDFNQILPQAKVLQNGLKDLQENKYKKEIFNRALTTNDLMSGLKFFERCRFIPFSDLKKYDNLIYVMNQYVKANHSNSIEQLFKEFNEQFKNSKFYDFVCIISCWFLFSKLKQKYCYFQPLQSVKTTELGDITPGENINDFNAAANYLSEQASKIQPKSDTLNNNLTILKEVIIELQKIRS